MGTALQRALAALAASGAPVRWAVLLAASLAVSLVMVLAHVPAALMLGPMLTAVILSASGIGVAVPGSAYLAAQGIVGGLIASSLPPAVFGEIVAIWPIFTAAVLATIGASALIGWLLTRFGVVPGITAIWGSSPGAAGAMTILSAEYGADIRLVAFMQYLRVLCCALAAVAVAGIMGAGSGAAVATTVASLPAGEVAIALVACLGGAWLGKLLPVPGGGLMLPIVLGIAVKVSGLASMQLPLWILAPGYALLGWTIGMRFSREAVRHAAQVFPRILAGIVALITVCGGFAAALVYFLGIDPMTAYLATSPGGADTIAVIATSGHVDVAFVMAMQVGRFLVVLMLGPPLARWLTRHAQATTP